MPAPAFVAHIVDLLHPVGAITVKPMFGAWGIYCDGLFFAIVWRDVLYLKSDPVSAAQFEAAGLEAFVYESRVDEHIVTSYRRAPDAALEDPAVMAAWAAMALEAATRARAKKKPRRATAG